MSYALAVSTIRGGLTRWTARLVALTVLPLACNKAAAPKQVPEDRTAIATVSVAPVGGASVRVVTERKPARSALDGRRPLDLVVYIDENGHDIKAQERPFDELCGGRGRSATVPKVDDAYDFVGLRFCVSTLRKADPAFAKETEVTVTANPGTEYQAVIETIEALRSAGFPDVRFGVAKEDR